MGCAAGMRSLCVLASQRRCEQLRAHPQVIDCGSRRASATPRGREGARLGQRRAALLLSSNGAVCVLVPDCLGCCSSRVVGAHLVAGGSTPIGAKAILTKPTLLFLV